MNTVGYVVVYSLLAVAGLAIWLIGTAYTTILFQVEGFGYRHPKIMFCMCLIFWPFLLIVKFAFFIAKIIFFNFILPIIYWLTDLAETLANKTLEF